MPWGYFALALLGTYVVQTSVLPHFSPQWLDLLVVLALVCGLTAPAAEARLAGWIAGFAQDAGTAGPIGLHAFTLGLAILVLTYLREMVNRQLWWVRGLVAFVVAMPAQLLVHLHIRLYQGASLPMYRIFLESAATAAAAAVLAALLVGLPGAIRRRQRRHSAARW
jgi:rod shape-determining protein MreD